MKRIIAIALLLVGFTAVSTAQVATSSSSGSKPKKTPEERAASYANKMAKELGLDAAQKNKVQDLALARAKKMSELREKYKGQDKKVWKEERKKVRDEFHNGMKSTLNPVQYAKWIEMQKKKAEKAKAKAKAKAKGKAQQAGSGAGTDEVESDEDPELDAD